MVAGVGQPVGVLGLSGKLVILPLVTSSASRLGVKRVFSGVGPAPDKPGIVEIMVFPRIIQKIGFLHGIFGDSERKGIDNQRMIIFYPLCLNISAYRVITL
jgi:hypothetical protein